MESLKTPRLRHIPEDWIMWKFNAHAHSTESDGELTIEEIDTIAKEWQMNGKRREVNGITGGIIGVTDHNTVKAHENFVSPNIVPGIEVKVRREDYGVDLLLYHTREKLLAFCHDVIYPKLNSNPKAAIMGPTRLALFELLDAATDAGCAIVIPHYYHVEGISVLPKELQENIAKKYAPIVEFNGRLRRWWNHKAWLFAHATYHKPILLPRRKSLPVIATGDSHLRGHFTSSYTKIPLPLHIDPTGPNLFRAIRRYNRHCKRKLEDPSTADTVATAYHIIKKGGMSVVSDYIKRWFTHTPKPIAPDDPTVQQQLLERLQREGEDDADDS
ncbi:hypothetical protein A2635_02270 [Candidatus Peribacteria bacterium RIFCSPHIGHO2_01_FULL_51_9]|nr:MAG: hypothetical protein A2635_02270 [Candidatus Peribacteria bacterium RIFCSPHIGHO2_01_FULL_51_9]